VVLTVPLRYVSRLLALIVLLPVGQVVAEHQLHGVLITRRDSVARRSGQPYVRACCDKRLLYRAVPHKNENLYDNLYSLE